ncbi:hypothetical protein J437_LFUL007401 [Ladona fulva]|uniref:Reverse transcriptase domain-containing protein n=1 Tax=Ladona fulva TaxID=123851 RepID=A0A8K0K0V2_LADFU|nr:hypothetical protein J437_LFUL007401 [Ladona fulva]
MKKPERSSPRQFRSINVIHQALDLEELDRSQEDDEESKYYLQEDSSLSLKKVTIPGSTVSLYYDASTETFRPYVTVPYRCAKGLFPNTWKRGIIKALLKSEEKDEIDAKSYRSICLLPVLGAFDRVWWPGVFHRLYVKGVKGDMLRVITDYLKGRSGNSIEMIAYADDGAILIGANSRREIEEKANRVTRDLMEWCKMSKMELSKDKTIGLMLKGSLDSERLLRVFLEEKRIKIVDEVKYLGVLLTKNLGINKHITEVADRGRKKMGGFFELITKTKIPYKAVLYYFINLTPGPAKGLFRRGLDLLNPLRPSKGNLSTTTDSPCFSHLLFRSTTDLPLPPWDMERRTPIIPPDWQTVRRRRTTRGRPEPNSPGSNREDQTEQPSLTTNPQPSTSSGQRNTPPATPARLNFSSPSTGASLPSCSLHSSSAPPDLPNDLEGTEKNRLQHAIGQPLSIKIGRTPQESERVPRPTPNRTPLSISVDKDAIAKLLRDIRAAAEAFENQDNAEAVILRGLNLLREKVTPERWNKLLSSRMLKSTTNVSVPQASPQTQNVHTVNIPSISNITTAPSTSAESDFVTVSHKRKYTAISRTSPDHHIPTKNRFDPIANNYSQPNHQPTPNPSTNKKSHPLRHSGKVTEVLHLGESSDEVELEEMPQHQGSTEAVERIVEADERRYPLRDRQPRAFDDYQLYVVLAICDSESLFWKCFRCRTDKHNISKMADDIMLLKSELSSLKESFINTRLGTRKISTANAVSDDSSGCCNIVERPSDSIQKQSSTSVVKKEQPSPILNPCVDEQENCDGFRKVKARKRRRAKVIIGDNTVPSESVGFAALFMETIRQTMEYTIHRRDDPKWDLPQDVRPDDAIEGQDHPTRLMLGYLPATIISGEQMNFLTLAGVNWNQTPTSDNETIYYVSNSTSDWFTYQE